MNGLFCLGAVLGLATVFLFPRFVSSVSSVCVHGNYEGDSEACGRCASERRPVVFADAHRLAELARVHAELIALTWTLVEESRELCSFVETQLGQCSSRHQIEQAAKRLDEIERGVG